MSKPVWSWDDVQPAGERRPKRKGNKGADVPEGERLPHAPVATGGAARADDARPDCSCRQPAPPCLTVNLGKRLYAELDREAAKLGTTPGNHAARLLAAALTCGAAA